MRSQAEIVQPLNSLEPNRRKNSSRQRVKFFTVRSNGAGFDELGGLAFAFGAAVAGPPLGGEVGGPGVFDADLAQGGAECGDVLEAVLGVFLQAAEDNLLELARDLGIDLRRRDDFLRRV